jgi:hypothetical protein
MKPKWLIARFTAAIPLPCPATGGKARFVQHIQAIRQFEKRLWGLGQQPVSRSAVKDRSNTFLDALSRSTYTQPLAIKIARQLNEIPA